jgi:hypothetical protein
MASEPPPDKPVDIDDFRAAVERQLDNLRTAIGQTGRPPEYFLEQALEHEKEILGEVAPQREAVRQLKVQVRWEVLRAAAVLGSSIALALGAALALLDLSFGIPTWLKAAATVLVASGLALPGLIVLLTRKRRRKRSETSSTDPSTSSLPLAEQLRSAESNYREALDSVLQRWLTELANEKLGTIYEASLPDLDPTGLAEVDDSKHEIPTKASEETEETIEHMPGGSIGISGPRGAGKTTLLQRVTTTAWQQRPEEIEAAIMVDAPVEYDARDFVLHLFARLCEAVLDSTRVEEMRNGNRGFGPSPLRLRPLGAFATLPPLLGPLLLGAGFVAYLAVLDAQNRLHPADVEPWAIAAIALGGALILLRLLARLSERMPGMRILLGPLSLSLVFRDDSLERRAEQHLRQIWFQRTFSSGWSGALKTPIGVEAGAEQSTQLAENQLSFPDVVALYKDFVKRLAEDGQVRIGIDELDKMDDERARRFLNEIKVIFRVSGCFYLVSVSEDAMAYFERRGLPFRDVFDSSFDDVMRMGYLPYVNSRDLIRGRVVGMPIQFISLCHVLGGGLARDVIRAAREVCESESGKTIAEVSDELCTEQLRSKCVAARVAVRRLADPARVILLSRWLREIDESASSAAILLARCAAFEEEVVAGLGAQPSDDPEGLKEYREALSIALEVATFAYFVATVRQLMATLTTKEATRTVIHNAAVDRLAEARQAFAINPGEAWDAISAIRSFPIGSEKLEFPVLQAEESTPVA